MPTEQTPLLPAAGAASGRRAKPKPPTWRQIWRTAAPLTRPATAGQAALMLAALVAIVVEKFVHVLPPLALKFAVDTIADNARVPLGEAKSPYFYVLLYFALETATMLLETLRQNAQSLVEVDLDRRVSVHMFAHLHSLSLGYHLSKKSGIVIRVMDRGVDAVSKLMNILAYEIAPTLLETVIVTAVFVKLGSVWIAISTFVSVVAYTAYGLLVTGVRVRLVRETNDAWEAVGNRQVESLSNYETVKSFGKTEQEVRTYETLRNASQAASVKLSTRLSLLYYLQSVIYSLGRSSGLLIGAFLTVFGSPRLSPGDFVLISMYIGQLFGPLINISWLYRDITDSLTDLEKAVAILLQKPEIVDAPTANDISEAESTSGGDVVFENVSFHYKESEADIVDIESDSESASSDEDASQVEAPKKPPGGVSNISFHIAPGKTLTLCGKSGSGKSTITRLLLRLYDCDEGRVLVNGLDVRSDITQTSLRSIVGIVSQEVVLFNDSLRHNVSYGKPGASDPECRAAMVSAAMGSFLDEREEGLDTVVGDRGLRLSGGERQRVGSARILLKDPQIMVLDEATSALDSKTEKLIQKEVRERCTDRTTLVIAHRLSTIVHADEIILLDKGAIKERGTHRQLLDLGGEYAHMWKLQTSAEPLDSKVSSGEEETASSSSSGSGRG